MEELLTSAQVAHRSGTHVSYVQRARRIGEVVAVKTTQELSNGISHKIYWYSPDIIEVLKEMKANAKRNKLNRRLPATAVRYCEKPYLAGCTKLPNPYPCTRFDMKDACELCAQRYGAVSAGASSGWTTEQIGSARFR